MALVFGIPNCNIPSVVLKEYSLSQKTKSLFAC
jgi:hypothetical protein